MWLAAFLRTSKGQRDYVLEFVCFRAGTLAKYASSLGRRIPQIVLDLIRILACCSYDYPDTYYAQDLFKND